MLRTLIICPEVELSQRLEAVLGEFSSVGLLRTMTRYPSLTDLMRFVRAHAPDVVFISIRSVGEAQAIVEHLEQVMPGIQMAAIDQECDPTTLMAAMRCGLREFLAMPFEMSAVRDCLVRFNHNLEATPVKFSTTDLVYSFLPAKPGVGTSTIAVNAALALSADENMRALLMDFDLNCGMTRFMLKLNSGYSVLDAAQHASHIDEEMWPQLVNRRGNLDILHGGRTNQEYRFEALHIRHLLTFARRNYNAICIDLSGNLEKYAVEVMHESKRIFVVCTPEVAPVYMARERHEYLKNLDLADRAVLLLNRSSRKAQLTPKQVEELVGLPVQMSFPNDYVRINNALEKGTPVEKESEFGRMCSNLAQVMLQRNTPKASDTPRRFVSYFALTPAHFSLDRGRKNS